MSATNPFEEIFSPQGWGSEPSQVLDIPDCETLTSTFPSPFESYAIEDDASSGIHGGAALTARRQPSPEKLTLLQLADWNQLRAHNDPPQGCIHYAIEWKATINGKMYWTDTDQDVVLAPGAYFQSILQPKLDDILRRRRSGNRSLVPTNTDVAVSVTKRGERSFKTRFESLEIQWSIVENQLVTWGELFRAGKKLIIVLSFNYEDASLQSRNSSSKKADKRGTSSATNAEGRTGSLRQAGAISS